MKRYFKGWETYVLSMGLALVCWLNIGDFRSLPVANAATAVKDTPVELRIHLGTAAGELTFVPDDITVQAGTRYKFVLDNPSSQKHYFTAKDFADAIWSQKVDAGNVEVKGAIHELEIRSGATADWVFIPMKPGQYELHCSIAGHAEAGMVGQITVTE